MRRLNFFKLSLLVAAPLLLAACQTLNIGQIKRAPSTLVDLAKNSVVLRSNADIDTSNRKPLPLEVILDGSLAGKNLGIDFETSLKYALEKDPAIILKRKDIEARLAVVSLNRSQKEFQVGTTVYGGIEDITDNTKGVAIALNTSKSVFDGGKADYQIESAEYAVSAARLDLVATLDKRANELCGIWLNLEKYKELQSQIDKRLKVLDPLIHQLEKVAEAGIGDVSKVTAAQLTVSAIRVEQSNIAEGLAQAQLKFLNAFGPINESVLFDYELISKLVPAEINGAMVQNSPLLQSQYASYQSSLARLKSLHAKSGFDVGFEARVMRPFAGSGYDSDESVGLVGRKTLFNGGMLKSEIKEAEANLEIGAAQIKVSHREGANAVKAALQNIDSMDRAILIARENAKIAADEIIYLRQQLIIGGSTLDSVLTAEARLYEAESKEATFMFEKRKSELIIVSSLGLLSKELGF